MTSRFTDTLRTLSQSQWAQAVTHRFVRELYDGSINHQVMINYLVQDYRFLDSFLTLVGSAIACADTPAARLCFGRCAGMVSSEENTYFLRAFAALGVSEQQRNVQSDTAPTVGFKAIMLEAAATRSYAAILTVLNVAEWLYLDWASQAPEMLPASFVHAEWITLHNNPDFCEFVAFLRHELDRVGPEQRSLCEDFFQRAVRLELAFFDAVYQ
ncbi:TenA family protein [Erwinia persicina]|uniref:TenA family protein n=1 Tax=Erwinia persicina TaxID=55211 RepID=UPI00165422AF|nr:TenA family protein [Erwinia persicina]MBC3947111.1 TenA family protein [Erwinia persicina]